jgi:hypothetical protein
MMDRTWRDASAGTSVLGTPTAPLPASPAAALSRLELAFAPRIVANFDNHGSLWGFDTVEEAERNIDEAHANGDTITEWETVDRDGQPLCVVRIATGWPLDDICVFSTWAPYARAVSA